MLTTSQRLPRHLHHAGELGAYRTHPEFRSPDAAQAIFAAADFFVTLL